MISGVYSIVCKDTNIQEVYVGSCEDFDRRLRKHKEVYNNKNSKEYNKNVYQFIRINGGWDNFKFIWLELFKTDDTIFLRQLEQIWMDSFPQELLLNGRRAYATHEDRKEQLRTNGKEYHKKNKEIIKENCKKHYEQHRDIISEKGKQKSNCPKCFKSMRKDGITRHLKTCKKNN